MKMGCSLRGKAIACVHRRRRALCFRGEEGNALVEIALVLPAFLAILMGIFSLGMMLSNQLTLNQATGAGGQSLARMRTSTTDPCKDTFTAITNASPSLASANIGLTLTMNGNTPITATTCSGDQSELVQGSAVTVSTTYPCKLSVYGVKFASSCQITAQVTEYEY